MKESTLIREYLSKAAKPSFNAFMSRHQDEVKRSSITIVSDSALKLQWHWMCKYNAIVRTARPRTKIHSKPEVANKTFRRIYEHCEAVNEAKHNLELEGLSTSEKYAIQASKVLQNVSSLDGNAQHGQKTSENLEEESTRSIAECLSKTLEADLPSDVQAEYKKLADSKCLNMMCSELTDVYAKIIPRHMYDDIVKACHTRKHVFEHSAESSDMINSIFTEMEPCRYDTSINNVLDFVDREKYEIKDKQSLKYQIFCAIDSMLKNFQVWKDEPDLSEATYLRKFEDVLEALLKGTDLKLKDGETYSKSSSRNQILNEYQATAGRRIDVLVTNRQKDEICSIEFKRSNASTKLLRHQQSKNMRINACILNEIHMITKDVDDSIFYMDFAGRNGYIAQVFRLGDVFIAHKIDYIYFPKSLLELDDVKRIIKLLLKWKVQCLKTHYKLATALLKEERRYSQVEYSNGLHRQITPENLLKPIDVFFTPSKGKRSRDVYEHE